MRDPEKTNVQINNERMTLEEAINRGLVIPQISARPHRLQTGRETTEYKAALVDDPSLYYRIDQATFKRWCWRLEVETLVAETQSIVALDPEPGVTLAHARDAWSAIRVGTVLVPTWHCRGDRADIVGKRFVIVVAGATRATGYQLDNLWATRTPFGVPATDECRCGHFLLTPHDQQSYVHKTGCPQATVRRSFSTPFGWDRFLNRDVRIDGPTTFTRLRDGDPLVSYRIIYCAPNMAASKAA
jgi:hypothetical protein